jgi:hypothetical protein
MRTNPTLVARLAQVLAGEEGAAEIDVPDGPVFANEHVGEVGIDVADELGVATVLDASSACAESAAMKSILLCASVPKAAAAPSGVP